MLKMYVQTLAILLCSGVAFAQSPRFTASERYTSEQSNNYLFSTEIKPVFIGGGSDFWYKYSTRNGQEFYLVRKGRKSIKTELFSRRVMAEQLSKLTGRVFPADSLPIQSVIFDKQGTHFSFRLGMQDFNYDIKMGILEKKIPVPPTSYAQKNFEPNFRYSSDRRMAVFSKGWNLFLHEIGQKDGKSFQLTNDGERFFNYADRESDTTSRLTLTGAKWLNNRYLYVLRKDNRRIRRMGIISTLSPTPEMRDYFYALPGDKEVTQYQLMVIDATEKKVRNVDISKWPDQTVEVSFVSADGSRLYFQRKNRIKNRMEICLLTVETGKVEVIIEDEGIPYLNEQLAYLGFLSDGKEIIFSSERTGWNHLYLYSESSKKLRILTKGNWVAGQVLRIDTAKRMLYLEGYGKEKDCNPYYSMIYALSLDNAKIKLLTPEFAMHRIYFDPKYNWFIDNYSRADMGPRSVLRASNGSLISRLEEADLSKLFASGWRFPENFRVKAADSVTDLFGVIWKPNDFQPGKTYPLISHEYPGPQTEELNLEFSVDGNFNKSLSELGALVVSMGHRGGSPQRNRAYHTFGYGNLRDFAIADDKFAIEQLAGRFNYIDTARVGIFGHSAGGAMAFTAMATYPSFYKVGVSASGNHDNTIYNQWWGESHQGVSQDSITGEFSFKVKTNMELADKLNGKLLLVSGDADENVHPAQTLKLADALIRTGKDFELVILPGQPHYYFGEGKMFFERKMWGWFKHNLISKEK